jgi:hypothetical protein
MKRIARILIVMLAVLTVTDLAFAQRRGGGGRGGGRGGGFSSRGGARPSVNARPSAHHANRANLNRHDYNRGSQRREIGDRNIGVNRDIHVDRDRNVGVNRNWDYDGCCYNNYPVARAAAVATGAAITAAAIGSVVYSLPYECSTVVVNGIAYEQCGSSWYQPQFVGTSTSYIVVGAPQ